MSALFVKASHRGLRKVDTINLVGLLVILCDDSGSCVCLLNRFIAILVSPFRVSPCVFHKLQNRVSPDNFEAHINVEQYTLLLHNQSRVEAWPHLDVVSVKAVRICLVERLLANLLELE